MGQGRGHPQRQGGEGRARSYLGGQHEGGEDKKSGAGREAEPAVEAAEEIGEQRGGGGGRGPELGPVHAATTLLRPPCLAR